MKSQKIELVTKEQARIILGELVSGMTINMDVAGLVKKVNKQIMHQNAQQAVFEDVEKKKAKKKSKK